MKQRFFQLAVFSFVLLLQSSGRAVTELGISISQPFLIGYPNTVQATPAETGATYQWSKDGALIANATSSSLTLNSLQLSDAGTYSVGVTDASGTSTAATVVQPFHAASIPGLVDTSFNPQPSGPLELFFSDGSMIMAQGLSGAARIAQDGHVITRFPTAVGTLTGIARIVQPDDKVIFVSYPQEGLQLYTTSRRYNADGTPDDTYAPTHVKSGMTQRAFARQKGVKLFHVGDLAAQ